jgi:hypothetical protein
MKDAYFAAVSAASKGDKQAETRRAFGPSAKRSVSDS